MPTTTAAYIIADKIGVGPIGAAGQCTVIFGQTEEDRKIWLYSPAPGVFISHSSGPRTTDPAFQLPANQVVQFDLPRRCNLYGLTAAGTIQVSRYSAPVMPTVGDALTQLIEALARRLGLVK